MSVLVYTENWDGKFKKISFEICSYASSVAGQLNTTSVAVTFGKVEEQELRKTAQYGISKIICADDDRLAGDSGRAAHALAEIAARENAEVIVFAGNNSARAIAPRLSVRMAAGMVSGVTALPSSVTPFIVRKKVFTSKAYADVQVNTGVRILTLSQNSFGLVEKPVDLVVESYTTQASGIAPITEITEVNRQTGKILLTDAEVVVSGGRGMKGPENWAPLEELAGLLGGATACSRPVSDEGWRPHSEHVGQTGKIIAPSLYIACGISGAIQHLGGVSSSKIIVAINKDKDAPIFEAANYGIVGDVQKVLPELLQAFREIKS